jgi:hypothetical protein
MLLLGPISSIKLPFEICIPSGIVEDDLVSANDKAHRLVRTSE